MLLTPRKKLVLKIMGAAYVLLVVVLVVLGYTGRKPHPKRGEIIQEFARVAKAHGHVLSERHAGEMYERYLAKKGDVFGLNYTVIMQVINFGFFMAMLYVLLWGPMIAFLDKRREDIGTEIESARQGNRDAQERLAEYEKKLQDARGERQTLLEDGQREAQQERQAILEQARQQAERILEAGRQEMEAEVARARGRLRGEIGGMSVQVAQRILEREIRPEDHDAMIEKFVHQIDSTDLKA